MHVHRQARIDAPGAVHHVIARGIERGKIFRDDEVKLFVAANLFSMKAIGTSGAGHHATTIEIDRKPSNTALVQTQNNLGAQLSVPGRISEKPFFYDIKLFALLICVIFGMF